MLKFLPVLLLASPLILAADASPDEAFYRKAAEGNLAELQQAQLAQAQEGVGSDVKEFAAQMTQDHGAANGELKSLAAKKGVDLPTDISAVQIGERAKLQALTGSAFEKAYIQAALHDHQAAIQVYEAEAQGGQDPDAKTYAAGTLPTLRMHLKTIQALAAKKHVPPM